MITFSCPNCGSNFPAKLRLKGIEYEADEKKYQIERDDDICHVCLEEAETAKAEALAKRKKNG